MSTLQEKAAKAKQAMDAENPTVTPGRSSGDRQRISLSTPMRKLELPAIPGYYLRWIKGTSGRLAQAERAGFLFVSVEEVQLNNVAIGGDATKDGNSDMGSRVSVVEGGEVDGGGNAIRLYLMKQKMEHYLEDQKVNQDRNDSVADALTSSYRQGSVGGRAEGETPQDAGLRYVDPKRAKVPDLFRKKGPR